MGLKGKYEWYESLHAGGLKCISFTLTCDNLFQSETFDCAITANNGAVQPMIFRNLSLKAKQSYRFNYDTVGWQWCNGDIFVLLGKNDSIKERWPLNLRSYAPGECPECHGTHKCRHCSGKGYVNLPNHRVERCSVCSGTGICQTCYIPQRGNLPAGFQQSVGFEQHSDNSARLRQIESLRRGIADLQKKIEKTEWDMRMMQLKDMDVSSSSVYLSYNTLLHRYNIQMINLQSQLEQLEQL